MQIGWSTLAFASGAVATTVVAVSVMSLNSQQVRDNAFHVCVAKDRVLRLVETDEPCPDGQQRLRLQEADVPDVDPPKETADMGGRKKSQEQAANESRSKERDKTLDREEFKKVDRPPAVSKVKAPFEVVDDNGQTILRIDSSVLGYGLTLYSPDRQPKALLIANDGGGYITAQTADGQIATQMTASSYSAEVRVVENDRIMADFGRTSNDSWGARFYGDGPSANPRAAIGISSSGTSMAIVGNGQVGLASMTAKDGKGHIQVASGDGVSLAMLGQSPNGGGLVDVLNSRGGSVAGLTDGPGGGMLQIATDSGTTVVEANVQGGVGVVRAGPAAFSDRAGLVRLSELRGKR